MNWEPWENPENDPLDINTEYMNDVWERVYGLAERLSPLSKETKLRVVREFLEKVGFSLFDDDFLEWLQTEVAEEVLDEAGFFDGDAA